jgi:hypothetical protein
VLRPASVVLSLALATTAADAGQLERTTADTSQVERLDRPGGSGSPAAREALALCARAAAEAPREAAATLERGLARAEAAVTLDDGDARAHFAVFCNLGRRLQLAGASVAAAAALGRLRAEVERALELAPLFVDALVGKGAMLASLPWLLGGDADEGERLIRAAIALAPDHAGAHGELAHVLEQRGDDGAAAEASLAARLASAAPLAGSEDAGSEDERTPRANEPALALTPETRRDS